MRALYSVAQGDPSARFVAFNGLRTADEMECRASMSHERKIKQIPRQSYVGKLFSELPYSFKKAARACKQLTLRDYVYVRNGCVNQRAQALRSCGQIE